MRAIRIHQFGGPEMLTLDDVPPPSPGAGQVRVRLEACGVNFIDIYQRTGAYKGALPLTLGQEAAGVVDALGADVHDVSLGQRVAFTSAQGTYADFAIVPVWRLVPLPVGVSGQDAAAVMLQGLTAHYLTHSTFALKRNDTALIHAAAGGVGLLLVQIAKRLGARVIGTTSSEVKARLVREAGADEAILYGEQDFVAEVKRLTNGKGVDVVYDSVGQTTFEGSLACLRPRGYMVLFGQSSGPAPAIDPQILQHKGSLFLTRPTLIHYTADRAELMQRAGDLFNWIAAGQLHVRIDKTFPLAQAAEAQRYLQSRQSKGKLLLIP